MGWPVAEGQVVGGRPSSSQIRCQIAGFRQSRPNRRCTLNLRGSAALTVRKGASADWQKIPLVGNAPLRRRWAAFCPSQPVNRLSAIRQSWVTGRGKADGLHLGTRNWSMNDRQGSGFLGRQAPHHGTKLSFLNMLENERFPSDSDAQKTSEPHIVRSRRSTFRQR